MGVCHRRFFSTESTVMDTPAWEYRESYRIKFPNLQRIYERQTDLPLDVLKGFHDLCVYGQRVNLLSANKTVLPSSVCEGGGKGRGVNYLLILVPPSNSLQTHRRIPKLLGFVHLVIIPIQLVHRHVSLFFDVE